MVTPATRTMLENVDATPACAHHWIIEPANGPTSRGWCRRCGAHRAFYNTFDDVVLTTGSWSAERKPPAPT